MADNETPYVPQDRPDVVYVTDPRLGKRGAVPRDQLDSFLKAGYRVEDAGETENARLEKEYGDSPVQTGLESAASTITFGASDLALRQLDPEGVRERRNRNEPAAIVGGIGGAVLTAGVGAGAGLGKAGVAAEELVTGGKAAAGLGTRLAGAGARAGVEGLGYGTGMGVSQVALSDEPITIEGAAATIGSNALLGGATGYGLGVAGKMLGEGATLARSYVAKEAEAAAAKAPAAVDRSVYPDIASMDESTAAAARVAEKGAVKAQRAADIVEGQAAYDAEHAALEEGRKGSARKLYGAAKEYKDFLKEGDSFIVTGDTEIKAMLGGTKGRLMKGLNNEGDFVEAVTGPNQGKKFLSNLRTQEEAANRVLSRADEILARAPAEREALLAELPKPRALYSGVDAGERTFAEQVHAAIPNIPAEGRFGDRKVFIRDLWETMGKPGTLDDFKAQLVAENRAGSLKLHRADLVQAMDPRRVAESEIIHPGLGGDTQAPRSHFVEINEDATLGATQRKTVGPGEHYLTPEQSKMYSQWSGTPITAEKPALAVNDQQLLEFRSALEDGSIQLDSVKRIEIARDVLERNKELQAAVQSVAAPVKSEALTAAMNRVELAKAAAGATPRLQALEAHIADLQKPRLGRTIAQGIGGSIGGTLGSPLGAPGAIGGAFVGRDIGNKLYDRFVRKLVNSNTERSAAMKANISRMFSTTASKTARQLPKATAILPEISYASKGYADRVMGPVNAAPSKSAQVTAFRERANELNAVTERGPGGQGFIMRTAAWKDMHDRLAAMWLIAPAVANGVEKLQAAKVAFLASKMPRDPTPPHLQIGPSKWEPTPPQLAKFARIMEVAEHPEVVPARVADGTVTPDDVETLGAIYPEHLAQIKTQCLTHASSMRTTLPYVKRLNLAILLDIDTDPALTREALSVYQAPPPPPEQAAQQQAPAKPLPTGMVAPTSAQHMSAS